MNSTNLGDVFVALGQSHANRPALESGSRSLSFAELARASSQAAHELRANGVRENLNVGICLRDGIDTAVYIIAAWLADATVVIMDFRSPAAERAALADEFDLATIISDTMPAAAPYRSIGLTPEFKERVARQPATPPTTLRDGNGIAFIGLTSGTTGRPLGIIVRHTEILARMAVATMHATTVSVGPYLVCSPLHFGAARTLLIDRMLRGRTIILYPPIFSAAELAEDVIRLAPTGMYVVPTILRGLLEYAKDKPAPLFPSLDELLNGGSMTTPQEKRDAVRLLSPNYRESYASVLIGGISQLFAEDVAEHADSVGRPTPLIRFELVDENDVPVPAGEPGNIRVRSPVMTSGTYKDRSREGGDRLKDGWIYPGDLVRQDSDGYLHIVGRSADTIIRGGGNVHPSEIESVLVTHPSVKEAYAVGYQTEREGEEIGAAIIAQGSAHRNRPCSL